MIQKLNQTLDEGFLMQLFMHEFTLSTTNSISLYIYTYIRYQKEDMNCTI